MYPDLVMKTGMNSKRVVNRPLHQKLLKDQAILYEKLRGSSVPLQNCSMCAKEQIKSAASVWYKLLNSRFQNSVPFNLAKKAIATKACGGSQTQPDIHLGITVPKRAPSQILLCRWIQKVTVVNPHQKC